MGHPHGETAGRGLFLVGDPAYIPKTALALGKALEPKNHSGMFLD